MSLFNKGDIVRLKSDHHLYSVFYDNCIIFQVMKFPISKKKETKYHIRTITGELKWAWVRESELDRISDIRNDKLSKLGI